MSTCTRQCPGINPGHVTIAPHIYQAGLCLPRPTITTSRKDTP